MLAAHETFTLSEMVPFQTFTFPGTAKRLKGNIIKGSPIFMKNEEGEWVRVINGQKREISKEFEVLFENPEQSVYPVY